MTRFILNLNLKLENLIYSANHAEDFIDKMVGTYTPAVIFCFTLLFTLKSTFFIQIECWCPHHWTRNWETYAEVVCWVSENYLNSSQRTIGQISSKDARKISASKPTSSKCDIYYNVL